MKYAILAVILVVVLPVVAAAVDYTVSTSTVIEEKALEMEASRQKITKQELLQKIVESYLKSWVDRLKEARERRLREGYESLSPTDKKTIEGLITGIP